MKRILIVALALLTLAAVPVSAQTYLTNTTLSAAISTPTATTPADACFNVASATTAAVGGAVYIDKEMISITSVSGTRICGTRGSQGTNATTHNSGANVLIAPVAALTGALPAFTQLNGRALAGSCNPANYRYLPIVDTDSGNIHLCWAKSATYGRIWSFTNLYPPNGLPSYLVTLQ